MYVRETGRGRGSERAGGWEEGRQGLVESVRARERGSEMVGRGGAGVGESERERERARERGRERESDRAEKREGGREESELRRLLELH